MKKELKVMSELVKANIHICSAIDTIQLTNLPLADRLYDLIEQIDFIMNVIDEDLS